MPVIVNAAVLPGHAKQKEGEEDAVERDQRSPEMNLSPKLVEMPTEHFREPVVERREHADDRDREEGVVEVGDHEHGVRQRHVNRDVTKEQAGYAAIQEGDNKCNTP